MVSLTTLLCALPVSWQMPIRNGISTFLVDFDFNQLTDSKDGGVFSNLVENVDSVGSDGYTLLTVFAGVGGILVFIIRAIMLAFSGNGGAAQEQKANMGRVLLGVGLAFCAIFLVSLLRTIGVNISENMTTAK